MKIYCVGGAVRDELLGLPVKDRDWVVVGATPAMLIERGYQPVGRDFPVFLHPQTHEEYALARTERKTAPGYRGFAVHYAPEVTLEKSRVPSWPKTRTKMTSVPSTAAAGGSTPNICPK